MSFPFKAIQILTEAGSFVITVKLYLKILFTKLKLNSMHVQLRRSQVLSIKIWSAYAKMYHHNQTHFNLGHTLVKILFLLHYTCAGEKA